jgi:hypothetical protein
MKRLKVKIILISIFVILIPYLGAQSDVQDYASVTVTISESNPGPIYCGGGPHVIEFARVEYDYDANTSAWHYIILSKGPPAVSHWLLEICADAEVLDAAYPEYLEVGEDKKSGFYGIKWNFPNWGDVWEREIWFTLQGTWSIAEVNSVIKASKDNFRCEVKGPSCTLRSPPEISIKSQLEPLNITQEFLDMSPSVQQPLGSFTLSILSNTSFKVEICYEVEPIPNPSFTSDPLKLAENPPGLTVEQYIPECPATIELLGFSGVNNFPDGEENTYPVEINLSKLGDRKANDSFDFKIVVEKITL